MQWHYVGLDMVRTAVPHNVDSVGSTSSQCSNKRSCKQLQSKPSMDSGSCDSDSVCKDNLFTDALQIDEDTFAEDDEHTRQLTDGSTASMLSIEDPEAFVDIVCLAPGEGQKPLYIMTDQHFESMSNPVKFPYGEGCFTDNRPRKLTYKKYFNQRLLNVDGRFASDIDYLFTAEYIVEAKQIQDDCNHFVWRQKPRHLTAGQAKNPTVHERGSPPYYQRMFHDMLAMIRQLGTPTWFFTLSAADLKWPYIIQTTGRQYGVTFTNNR